MKIRKTLDSNEPVVQSADDTNVQVVALFETKADLVSVTLTFAEDSDPRVKLYERADTDED